MSEPESPQGERAQWTPACAVAEVPEGGAVRVEIGDLPVCLVRSDGRFYAIRDVCSHAEVPLSEGEIEDTTVECWLHGSRFDLTTGKPTGPPATEPVPVYDTKIEDETVCIKLAGSAGDVTAGSAGDVTAGSAGHLTAGSAGHLTAGSAGHLTAGSAGVGRLES